MNATNVMFLDKDGVYHSDGSYLKYGQMVDIGAVKLLNKLIADHNLKVVFSSTWRIGAERHTVQDYLAIAGFAPEILHEDYKTEDKIGEHRGTLIAKWLSNHPEVSNYVIIDDDDDMNDDQLSHFIHVDSTNGFSVKDYYRAKSVFQGYTTTQCKDHNNKGVK